MTTLPDAPWRQRPGLAELVAALGDGNARFVGGAVRDTLLGLPVSDVDIATPIPPDEAMRRFRRAGMRVVPTGIDHGTVTVVLDSGPVEVTTLRRDLATDGRRATVAFSDDWRDDAARRDFTINALYADPADGAVHDWFGGLGDLAAGRVRFIGDPLRRIAEDHLRILRFFRFHARFGGATIDPAGLAACVARANDLMALSRERIADELAKLLVAAGGPAVLALMHTKAILTPVLPEIEASGIARLAKVARREAAFGITPSWERRLAALIPQDALVAEDIAARLRLSNARRKRIALAVQPLPDDATARATAWRIGVPAAIDRALLGDRDDTEIAAIVTELADFVPPRLPLNGAAVIAMGIPAGPAVARVLKTIEERWIAEDFPGEARVHGIAVEAADHWLREHSSR